MKILIGYLKIIQIQQNLLAKVNKIKFNALKYLLGIFEDFKTKCIR